MEGESDFYGNCSMSYRVVLHPDLPRPGSRIQKEIISSCIYSVTLGSPMSAVEQHVVDEKGNRIAVILPLTEYQNLKEDLHDLAMVAERRDEGTIDLAELKKRVL